MANCVLCTEFDSCPWRSDPDAICSAFKQRPMTNADRIRSMSDEELAVWIAETSCCSDWCILRDACDKKQEHECCINVWLEWLREEAKEDG